MYVADSKRLTAAGARRAVDTAVAQARELKVCADPNNLPFSNRTEQGFENRLVRLVARELHADGRVRREDSRREFDLQAG